MTRLGDRTDSPVRLGGARRSKWVWIAAAGAVLSCGVGIAFFFGSPDSAVDETAAKAGGQCRADADCKARHICLQGGCAPLLSSQDPFVWHADLAAQTAQGSSWSPPLEAGELLPATATCPAPRGTIAAAEPGKVRTVFDVAVYEVRHDSIRLHRFAKGIGQIWVDNLGFDFPRRRQIDPLDVCASASVSQVQVLQGVSDSLPGRVLAQLRQAVPANTTASAAVSVRFEAPAAGEDGARTLVVPLPGPLGTNKRVTVVALPLGAQIDAMRGPAPAEQRLLRGFFAYYFRPSATSEVAIVYRLSAPTSHDLALPTVRP